MDMAPYALSLSRIDVKMAGVGLSAKEGSEIVISKTKGEFFVRALREKASGQCNNKFQTLIVHR